MLEKISWLIPPETRIDYKFLVSGSFTLPPGMNMKICRTVLLYINETSFLGRSQICSFNFFCHNYSMY